jgi:hypothetical protein
VNVGEGFKELVDDEFELRFGGSKEAEKVGEGQVVHDQVALLRLHLEEQCVVGDDVTMLKVFDVCEVLLQKQDMLSVEAHCFYRSQFPSFPTEALLHHPVGALPDLVAHDVPVREDGAGFVVGVDAEGVHVAEDQFGISQRAAGLAAAVLLQFDLQLEGRLLEDGQRGEGEADVCHVGASLLQLGLWFHRIIDSQVNHQNQVVAQSAKERSRCSMGQPGVD